MLHALASFPGREPPACSIRRSLEKVAGCLAEGWQAALGRPAHKQPLYRRVSGGGAAGAAQCLRALHCYSVALGYLQ